MKNMLVMLVLGTRPEIIKLAPIIRELDTQAIEYIIVHTGQHYDYEMSKIFFEVLHLPVPKVNLSVGSDTHVNQLSKMLSLLEELICTYDPTIVLAVGDTNSVLATSLVCVKTDTMFGHVEAGLRSFDNTMPEEINRKISDITANMHFVPSNRSAINLVREGIEPKRIFVTGNTIVDATFQHLDIAKTQHSSEIDSVLEGIDKKIILCTFHRPSNINNIKNYSEIIETLEKIEEYTIIYPIHPHSLKKAKEFKLYSRLKQIDHLYLMNPLDYLSFLYLMSKADIILTDSGGIQEEAVTLKKPCITVRTNTERPETVELGVNLLTKVNSKEILKSIEKTMLPSFITHLSTVSNPYGDGIAAKRIVDNLNKYVHNMNFEQKNMIKLQGRPSFGIIRVVEDIELEKLEERINGTITVVYDKNGDPRYRPAILKSGYIAEYTKI